MDTTPIRFKEYEITYHNYVRIENRELFEEYKKELKKRTEAEGKVSIIGLDNIPYEHMFNFPLIVCLSKWYRNSYEFHLNVKVGTKEEIDNYHPSTIGLIKFFMLWDEDEIDWQYYDFMPKKMIEKYSDIYNDSK